MDNTHNCRHCRSRCGSSRPTKHVFVNGVVREANAVSLCDRSDCGLLRFLEKGGLQMRWSVQVTRGVVAKVPDVQRDRSRVRYTSWTNEARLKQ